MNDQPQIFHEELFVLLGEGLQDGPYRGRPALVMPDAFHLWEMLLRAFRYCHACAAMIDRICKEFVLKAVGRGHWPRCATEPRFICFRSDNKLVQTLQNITLDHPDRGISCDQTCKWGTEWDLCASTYLKEESHLEASF